MLVFEDEMDIVAVKLAITNRVLHKWLLIEKEDRLLEMSEAVIGSEIFFGKVKLMLNGVLTAKIYRPSHAVETFVIIV